MFPVVREIEAEKLLIVFYDDFVSDFRKIFTTPPIANNPKYKDYKIASISVMDREPIEKFVFSSGSEQYKKKKKK